jgi:hypothetical protein
MMLPDIEPADKYPEPVIPANAEVSGSTGCWIKADMTI